MPFPWAKLYTEMLNDHIVRRLDDRQFRLFINLILLARDLDEEVNQDGRLDDNGGTPLTQDDLAWRLRIDTVPFGEDLAVLMELKPSDKPGLISTAPDGCFVVTAFGKRQARRASDMPEATRERKRKQRNGQKPQEASGHEEVTADGADNDDSGHDPVTRKSQGSHKEVTTPDLDSDSDLDSDLDPESDTDSHTPQKRGAPNAKKTKSPSPANPASPAPVRDASKRPKRVSLGTGDPQTDAVNAAADASKVQARDLVACEIYRVMTPDLNYPQRKTKHAKESRRPFELAAEKVLERVGRENYEEAMEACWLLLTEPTDAEEKWLAQVTSPHGLVGTIAKRVGKLRAADSNRFAAIERNKLALEHLDMQPPAEKPVAADGVPAEYADIWRKAKEDLELTLGRGTYDTHLRGAVLQNVTEEGELVVCVNNEFSASWLEGRLKPAIKRTLAWIAGRPVEISFVARNGADHANEH